MKTNIYILSDTRVIDPGKVGIVGHRGPDDKQAFLVGFFKMARGELNLRHRRSADQSENSTPNEAENYYYWGKGSDSYCKFHKLRTFS